MRLVIHDGRTLVRILDGDQKEVNTSLFGAAVVPALIQLAQESDVWILWCHQDYQYQFNWEAWQEIFRHYKIMASYNAGSSQLLAPAIGYVENTPFVTIKPDVTYPSWMMSSDMGGVHAKVLERCADGLPQNHGLDYFLNSLGKLCLPLGLYCYSDPRLTKGQTATQNKQKASTTQLFRFVRQHYKKHWVWILFACMLVYEKRFPLWALLNCLGLRQKTLPDAGLDDIVLGEVNHASQVLTYDVVIPTIGRKEPLYDFLKDLADQTLKPHKVIIVEQNPDPGSQSELDYLRSEAWPFQISHQFIHESGACNARNLAIAEVESPWTFLGDDDIRLERDLMERLLHQAEQLGVGALVSCCLQPHEKQTYFKTRQTGIFGSGTSVVRSSEIKKVAFDTGFEFGYGEDSDFGMQLRNNGVDVAYCAETVISHLKAPIGGFRTKFEHPWTQDQIQPKPSPTIMLYHLKHNSEKQLKGYQLSYFIRYYRKQKIKNPFRYLSTMKKAWKRSQFWAKHLMNSSTAHA